MVENESRRHGNKVIAVFSNYAVYSVYYTENGGASWKKVAGNLETGITGTGDGPSVRWASILLLLMARKSIL